ncbi:MAG: phosphate acetyltransferase [Candidatus Saganbacteria bacterium]|nr:phosphate acetyltransferase [Candidatus Saganbacteria bacterium]
MEFLENTWNKAKRLQKRIILPETDDIRIIKASDLILKSRIACLILIGSPDKINSAAASSGIDLSKAEIVDPSSSPKLDRYIEIYMNNMKAHKHDISYDDAKKLLTTDYPFFGAMMIAEGDADGMVTGADHATAHTIKAAVYSVGLAEGIKILSSFFIMVLKTPQFGVNGVLFYADCGVVPDPDDKQLCDITLSTADSFRKLMGREPRIAMLSFSTMGSGSGGSIEKVKSALKMIKEKSPDLAVDGEMQADAALIASIGKKKAPESKVAGRANVLIFPNLDAGNIGYKLTERLADATALGPLLQGCAKPINDLSRGCSVDDIATITAVTALQV